MIVFIVTKLSPIGFNEGYAAEKQQLEEEIGTLEDKNEALIIELEKSRSSNDDDKDIDTSNEPVQDDVVYKLAELESLEIELTKRREEIEDTERLLSESREDLNAKELEIEQREQHVDAKEHELEEKEKSINDITLNITSHVVPKKYVLISRRKRMYIISCMKTNIDEYHRKL